MLEQAIKALEDREWNVDIEQNYILLEWYSPAGEDYVIERDINVLESDILYRIMRDEYEWYDVDEHVDLWCQYRGSHGVPDSYSVLIRDAEAIEKELYECQKILEKLL